MPVRGPFVMRVAAFGAVVIGLLAAAVMLVVFAGWTDRFHDRIKLPNDMVLVRSFAWTWQGRNDLLSTDGRTRLARGVELVCFDDRYVWVSSYLAESAGIYDAKTNATVPDRDRPDVTTLLAPQGGGGCNGYYTAAIGPGLLYEGNEAPFLPSCDWRNLDNSALQDRSWFERSCQ